MSFDQTLRDSRKLRPQLPKRKTNMFNSLIVAIRFYGVDLLTLREILSDFFCIMIVNQDYWVQSIFLFLN